MSQARGKITNNTKKIIFALRKKSFSEIRKQKIIFAKFPQKKLTAGADL